MLRSASSFRLAAWQQSLSPALLLIALALFLLLSLPRYSSASFAAGPQIKVALHRRNHQTKQFVPQREEAATIKLFADKKNSNSGKEFENKRAYTKIEDGSPLGVAVVAIGGLLYTYGGDNFFVTPFLREVSSSSSAVWIIFATASSAAGLSRLFRYLREKRKND